MHTAIHDSRDIDHAQRKFHTKVCTELGSWVKDIGVGFPGPDGPFKPPELPGVFSNNKIWFAYRRLGGGDTLQHWNAFGAGPPALQRSNDIVVQVTVAFHGVDGRVAGLFAVDNKTKNISLLHRGRINITGGKRSIGQVSFLEWYSGKKGKIYQSFA